MIFLVVIILFVFVAGAMLAGLLVSGTSYAFGNKSIEKFQAVWFTVSGIILIGGIIYFVFVIL